MIAVDKILHLLAGYALVDITLHFFPYLKIVAIGISIIAGVLKEFYDYKNNGKFDLYDLFFTVSGGLMAYFLSYV